MSIRPLVSATAPYDISAAHWEVIRTMIASIQEKREDRERKCWHVWDGLCQALKICPGKHMYDGGLWVHTGCFLLHQVMCCAVAGENAPWGHVPLPSLALGLGQVHSSCLSPWANNRHTHKNTPMHVGQMCQIRGNIWVQIEMSSFYFGLNEIAPGELRFKLKYTGLDTDNEPPVMECNKVHLLNYCPWKCKRKFWRQTKQWTALYLSTSFSASVYF